MRRHLPVMAWHWLTYSKSLTERLQKFTRDRIQFRLVQNWKINNEKIWIRKSEWHFENAVWIKADLLMSDSSVNQNTKQLLNINQKPIGEILFQDPKLKRSDFLFYQHTENLTWSRKSIFHFKQQPIELIETFYPAFFKSLFKDQI